MKPEGGILNFSKNRRSKSLTPPDIIGVNFTKDELEAFPELEIFRHIQGTPQPLTVAVDWFEVFLNLDAAQLARIPTQGKDEQNFFEWTENVILSHNQTGSKVMANIWDVILMEEGEQFRFAELLTHPRNPMGQIRETSAWLKIKNENLYRAGWIQSLYQFLNETGSDVHNITRLDIAIDGLNDLPTFLNFYTKQSAGKKRFYLMGKAQFHPGKQDHKTMNFNHFRIGTSTSEKVITIYEKAQELEVSNKQYIKDFWKVNGLIPTNPQTFTQPRFSAFCPDYVGKLPIVYRCELRLKSKAIESIQDFDITRLDDWEYLSSIFVTQVKSSLCFALYTDSNISRCKQFFPIDFESLSAELLETTKKAQKDHRYKAKMHIHSVCESIYKGKATGIEGAALLDGINYELREKNLSDWFANVLPKYEARYRPFFKKGTDEACLKELDSLRSEIQTRYSFFHESKEEREEFTTSDGGQLDAFLDEVIEARNRENQWHTLPEAPF